MKFIELPKTEVAELPPTRAGQLAALQLLSAMSGWEDLIPTIAMSRFKADIVPRILTLWLEAGGLEDLEVIFDPGSPLPALAAAFERQAKAHQNLIATHLREISEILEEAMASAIAP